MSSALGYYAAKNRASERLETKRNEISRSSAYIIDSTSSRPSYSSYSSSTNNYGDTGRTGRNRYRDSSTDYSSKLRKVVDRCVVLKREHCTPAKFHVGIP